MKLKLSLFLLAFLLCFGKSQVVFTETFSDFVPRVAQYPDSTLAFTLYDSLFLNSVYPGIKVAEDIINSEEASFLGFATYGQVIDSVTATHPFRTSSTALQLRAAGNFFYYPGMIATLKPKLSNFAVIVIASSILPQGGERGYLRKGAYGNIGFRAWENGNNIGITFTGASGSVTIQGTSTNYGIASGDWKVVVFIVDRVTDTVKILVNGVETQSSTSIATITGNTLSNLTTNWQTAGIATTASNTYTGKLLHIAYVQDVVSPNFYKSIGFLPYNWIASQGNVTRNLDTPEFFITAWSDTLCVPLPNTTLGNNQEWVLTSSNIDGVTAWIGSRSSAKSVKKTITGGVSFTANTTYFGDGFSLVGDSLVVVFPADTASVDNIVLSKASHHLIRNVTRWLTW